MLTVEFMSSDESDEEVGLQVADSSESDGENPEAEQAPQKNSLLGIDCHGDLGNYS